LLFGSSNFPTQPGPAIGNGSLFHSAMLLMAAMWVIELTSELQQDRNVLRSALLSILGGPLLGWLFGLAIRAKAPSLPGLGALAEAVLPQAGQPVLWGIGLLTTGIAWQMLALLMLREFQSIGGDGWLPEGLLRTNPRLKTPVRLTLAQSALTIGALSLMSYVNMAEVAAFTFLMIQIGVNAAAITLARSPRAANRPLRLPLYPAIPATGIAVNFLLLFALSLPAALMGVLWLSVGALVYLRTGREQMRTSQLGVTVFQDMHRRPNITSPYPVLVPVSNPETAMDLVAFGAAIARHFGGHVVIVQVIRVPEQFSLDSRRFQAQRNLDLMEHVLEKTEQLGVPVEGITRLSRSVSQGILDTLAEESARLLVMGWHARQSGAASRLGHILDEVIEQAPCDVAVLRGEWATLPTSVLVPVSGGPHAPRAARLALALTAEGKGEITLLNVARLAEGQKALLQGQELLKTLKSELDEPERVHTRVIAARSALEGILDTAEEYDALLLGASEQLFLDEQPFGDLPLRLAQETDKPLALVRGYTGLTSFVARRAWQSLSDMLPTLGAEEQIEVFQRMRRAARPNINYFVLIALSAIIATLGLLLNSPAVIIGAMLVAPLMSPIVAIATGVVFGDVRVLRDATTSTIQGVLAAIFLATLTSLISPLAVATPEILARTRPNLLDLGVALASGLAGAYAIARKEVGEALPGVAIAAALMPPVCTIGIGIALGSAPIAFGALLLFAANLVAITFSSVLVFLLLGIRPPRQPDRQRRLRQGLIISVVSLLVISIPLGFILFQAVQQDRIRGQALTIVQETAEEWGAAELVDFNVEQTWREVTISGTLYATHDITDADLQALKDELEATLRREVSIKLFAVQGTLLDAESP
ncbi:MAG TPA: TIGR00341 family protein, partial [Chloroflexi bacterium]|nr:TIGR00341 family protein [Chloroflexota bacterium]